MTLEEIAEIGNAVPLSPHDVCTAGEALFFDLGKKVAVLAIVAAMRAHHAEVLRQIDTAWPEGPRDAP